LRHLLGFADDQVFGERRRDRSLFVNIFFLVVLLIRSSSSWWMLEDCMTNTLLHRSWSAISSKTRMTTHVNEATHASEHGSLHKE
jgi:hypothetical protein